MQCGNWYYTKILPKEARTTIWLDCHEQHIVSTSPNIGSPAQIDRPSVGDKKCSYEV